MLAGSHEITHRAAGWRLRAEFRNRHSTYARPLADDSLRGAKAPNVLRGMGLAHLTKNDSAKKELAKKGMALE